MNSTDKYPTRKITIPTVKRKESDLESISWYFFARMTRNKKDYSTYYFLKQSSIFKRRVKIISKSFRMFTCAVCPIIESIDTLDCYKFIPTSKNSHQSRHPIFESLLNKKAVSDPSKRDQSFLELLQPPLLLMLQSVESVPHALNRKEYTCLDTMKRDTHT